MDGAKSKESRLSFLVSAVVVAVLLSLTGVASGDCVMIPGDRLYGEINTVGDTDTCIFDAVQGTTVIIVVHRNSGSILLPQVQILDPDAAAIVSYGERLRLGGRLFIYRAVLSKDGEYQLSIKGGSSRGETGEYVVRSRVRYPAIGGEITSSITPTVDTRDHEFRAVKFSSLSVSLTSYGSLDGKFYFIDPSDNSIGPMTALPVWVALESGVYTVRVYGECSTTGDYTVQWSGSPPESGSVHTEGPGDNW